MNSCQEEVSKETLIAKGGSAEIYHWGKKNILKLYNRDIPKEHVEYMAWLEINKWLTY